MKSFDVIMIMVAVLQPIATALIGWLVIKINKLDRESGENKKVLEIVSDQIKSIVLLAQREQDKTDKRFDQKKDKE